MSFKILLNLIWHHMRKVGRSASVEICQIMSPDLLRRGNPFIHLQYSSQVKPLRFLIYPAVINTIVLVRVQCEFHKIFMLIPTVVACSRRELVAHRYTYEVRTYWRFGGGNQSWPGWWASGARVVGSLYLAHAPGRVLEPLTGPGWVVLRNRV